MALINCFYDSPVDIVFQARNEMEILLSEGVLSAARKFMVNIDEQKLKEAILHDKKRYSAAYHAGYMDGYNAAILEMKENGDDTNGS